MIVITPLPAFNDNYIWMLLHLQNNCCAVVDPGTAQPVLTYLQQHHLSLCAILITHHHPDHTGGIAELTQHCGTNRLPVYGPRLEAIAGVTHPLDDSTVVTLPELGLTLDVLAVPGHTRGHIAYFAQQQHALFCGDTLFAGGCGRLFEGSAAELYHSLCRLKALPEDTEIYCAHEYTQANLRFAALVEPDNSALKTRIASTAALRAQNQPTVPSTLALELQTNPFLRCEHPAVRRAVMAHTGQDCTTPTTLFAALRQWKDKAR